MMKPTGDEGSKDSSECFIERIRSRLYSLHGGAQVQISGPVHVRDNSAIFHARIHATTPWEAAVKHCLLPKTNTPDQIAANQQFEALGRVHRALAKGDSRFAVPAPLYLDHELATFAMGWVDGESVSRKLRHPAVFFKGADWFKDIGAWLGAFHRAGPIRRRPLKLDERLAVVDDLRASTLPHAAFSLALELLQETATPLQNIDTQVSWLHGDCKTDNFILFNNRIFGIDISLIHENSVELDLAQFLNNLSLMLSSPQYLPISRLRPQLEKAFWQGYQSTGPSVSLIYLDWIKLLFAVTFWHTMLHKRKMTVRLWVLNRIFSGLVERLCSNLELSQLQPATQRENSLT